MANTFKIIIDHTEVTATKCKKMIKNTRYSKYRIEKRDLNQYVIQNTE